MNTLIPESILGQKLAGDQRRYLEGFFSGLEAKGIRFGDAAPVPGTGGEEDLTAEERLKREEHPLDAYGRIADNARNNRPPDKEEIFRFKWHGLFFLTPVKDAFMARLRIPGGQLTSGQLRDLATLATDLTTGYVQITTRANLQMRLIEPKNAPEFLRRVRATGLHTQGSGADNVRNLTGNPTAGIDPAEIIDCSPLVRDLGDRILHNREFSNLPRKFNIAFDGGGLIGSVEDTNDIGIKAVTTPDGPRFRIALGGATGHKAFAEDLGVEVAPDEIVEVTLAILRVFIAKGNRTNRKRARLKHLLETWSLEKYLAAVEGDLGRPLVRQPRRALAYPSESLAHSHIGPFAQKQPGLHWLGVAFPAGQITPRQMHRLADLAEAHGSGELRLTVWQNLILPNIPDAYLPTVQKAVVRAGLDWRQSPVASGVIACTGNRFCKYSSTDTKGHAVKLSRYLEKKVPLDQPVNIHFTGCPHSCAQHYMGDIGLLGAKTQDGREAYHVFVGGGFGNHRAVGRQLFTAMPFDEVLSTVETMLTVYLASRNAGESFQNFTSRLSVGELQQAFS